MIRSTLQQLDKNTRVSSYGLLTAESLLKKIGVALPPVEISQQMSQSKSFYKALLTPFTHVVKLKYQLTQSEEALEITEPHLKRIDNTLADLKQHPHFKLSTSQLQKSQHLHNQIQENKTLIAKSYEQIAAIEEPMLNLATQQLENWENKISELAMQLMEKLRDYNLPNDFMEKFKNNLKNLTEMNLSPELIQKMRLKDNLSIVKKIFLATLLEEEHHGNT